MRPKVVGPDTEQRHNRARWLIASLIILILFIIILTGGHSEAASLSGGGCTGYTNAEATVIGFWHVPFSHVVAIEIGQDQGQRYTAKHYRMYQKVHISGIACEGKLQWFRMW